MRPVCGGQGQGPATRAKVDGFRKIFARTVAIVGLPRARRTVRPNGDVEFVWWVPPDWPHLPTPEPDTESF